MIFRQYVVECLAQISYLIGDETTGSAVVVDPRRDVEDYLAESKKLGLRIDHVLLTHFHADFISGHLELAEATGCSIGMGRRARADFSFVPLSDGESIDLGSVRLTALETPGHTPESVCYLVTDRAGGNETPHCVLTGDSLFIGDVGRPDLMASVGFTAEGLAAQLFESIQTRLLPLPDETLVYPGHGAGSRCGKNISAETVSTLGIQRAANYALGIDTREAFVRAVVADQPEPPAYFAYDADLNRRQRPTLSRTLERSLTPLSLEEVLRRRDSGTQILDVRTAGDFASFHLQGSINIGLDGGYATWAGWLLDRNRPVIILGERGQEREAVVRLGRVGLDIVEGYLDGGIETAATRPDQGSTFSRVDTGGLASALAGPSPPVILDIRSDTEREDRSIPGSIHIPLPELESRVAELPRNEWIVIHCARGYRSAIGASLVRRAEPLEATDLIGGIAAWEESGYPVVSGPEPRKSLGR